MAQLISQSGHSSIHLYESGSDELRTMYEIMNRTKGIYGGRFSGAGFKGCCMALIDPDYEEEIVQQVTKEYCPHSRSWKENILLISVKVQMELS